MNEIAVSECVIHGYCTIKVEVDDEGEPVDLIYVHVNEILAEIEGRSVDDLVGQRFYSLFPDHDRRWLRFYYEAAYEGRSVSLDDISDERGVYFHVEAYPAGKKGYCSSIICDIRESIASKLREKAMKEANEYAAVINALATIYTTIIEADLTTHGFRIIQTNSPFTAVTGGKSEGDFDSVMEDVLKFYMHPDDIGRMREFINLATLGERFASDTTLVTEYRAPYGKWFESRFIAKNRDDKGRVVSAIYAAKDVTAEKLKELHFREKLQEQLLVSDVLSRNFKNVYLVDMEKETAKILKLGDEFAGNRLDDVRDTEFPYEKILNKWIDEEVHPDDRAMLSHKLSAANLRSVFSRENEYSGNYRIVVDGRIIHYQFTLCLTEDRIHHIAGFQNVEDIIQERLEEERKQREKEVAYQEQLKEQLMIAKTLARSFRNAYFVDLEKETVKILKLEAGYVDIQREGIGHEFPFGVILDNWIENVVCPEDREEIGRIFTLSNVRKRLAEENEFTGNYRSIAGGETHYYQYNISKVDEKGTKAILGFQSIDEIIRAQVEEEEKRREIERTYRKKLEDIAEEAERANKAKTEFLMRMSHDIRTPLNGIRGMLDIADHYGDDLEKAKECREKIRESSNILMELINEVLDMSKLESGEVVLEHVPFSLTAIFSEVFTVVEKMAEEQTLEIIRECDIVHTRLMGSPIHLKRLLLNILGNAIKYNRPHGSVFVSCREVSSDGSTATLETVIRDTGIGMSESFQKHLFEPFQQENTAVRTKYGGTGLGLSIAKSLVDKMGGTIECESRKNVGTTFTITLPFEVDSEGKTDVAEESREEFSINGKTVLLVEDNDINLEIAEFLLSESGADVIVAHNGREAVDAFRESEKGEISAILMDLMMPVMDGYEAARIIRGMEREDAAVIPIIAMTANAFVEDRIATKNAGMNAHISKPLDKREVIRVISEEVKSR